MEDTIAAIATPAGTGGIGIIRISGEEAKSILDKIFLPANPSSIDNRKMSYGNIVDPQSKQIVDEVLCVYMKAPKTYTCEDVVEINCHGGMMPLRKTLELVLSNGARMAEPGEFTKRAFLNGRLDLSQAEAVIDVINAKTDKSFDSALSQLNGKLSSHIKEIRQKLVDVLVNITVNIDYPDEDIEEITYENLEKDLTEINESLEKLLESSKTGKIIRDGLGISIIGKPNVGKSSLMNNLLREERAIVTDIPGTTRDTIEEFISIKGIPVKLTDTAGIRDTDDVIEKIGIEKSKESLKNADLVMFIIDSSRPLDEEDFDILESLDPGKSIIVLNKVDLESALDYDKLEKLSKGIRIIQTSMETQKGVDSIIDEIVSMVYTDKVSKSDDVLVTNVRHMNLLQSAAQSIKDGIEMTRMMEALEFIEIDVNNSYQLLGEIIGETAADDIINEVFARFCLGK